MPMNGSSQNNDWLGLANRVCVVTGAASGIGAETARQLSLAGAYVALLDRNFHGCAAIADEIVERGGRAIAIAADVTRTSDLQGAATKVANELGPCEILVNNVGVLTAAALVSIEVDKWDQTISTNLTGSLICTQTFVKQMIENDGGGSIVNVSSIAAEQPFSNGGAYSVSKAGLSMLTRVLSVELKQHRIRCNGVAPAFVRTALSDSVYRDPAVVKKRAEMVPVGRIGTPFDIANVIAFLASDRSSYINGQQILVDGGLTQALMDTVPRPGFDSRADE
ncbi:short-chain dehydrogenase/reductase SDR [Caballeronia temeraria]|uniref:Short-chain dehydrogenase/reductase SDR n=1 Tax=Caballeronia temeraria TaxID=1777137 RepID=A0A158DJ69_9BURK|nr:SDR family oxidoreductase [Caballeronia temeraria]SAK94669.1 short-chain dehydrogenase/reductase SDR [Caballeronia temeraria]